MSVPSEVVDRIAHECGLEIPAHKQTKFANAIAKWQREKDSAICNRMDGEHDALYAEAILNQGEEW